MITSPEEIASIRKKIAALDHAAKRGIIDRMVELDEGVLLDAADALDLPKPDRATGSGLTTIPVPLKMEINDLGDDSRSIIARAMCFSELVAGFIKRQCRTKSDFAVSLRTYFCDLYKNLRHADFHGDDLFDAMIVHMREKVGDPVRESVAVAILVHLFLICDVFEKSGESAEKRLKKEAKNAAPS